MYHTVGRLYTVARRPHLLIQPFTSVELIQPFTSVELIQPFTSVELIQPFTSVELIQPFTSVEVVSAFYCCDIIQRCSSIHFRCRPLLLPVCALLSCAAGPVNDLGVTLDGFLSVAVEWVLPFPRLPMGPPGGSRRSRVVGRLWVMMLARRLATCV